MFGGCGSLLIQMPLLSAFFGMLRKAVALRGEEWALAARFVIGRPVSHSPDHHGRFSAADAVVDAVAWTPAFFGGATKSCLP
jgi:membrane protein insertase Oxa1/YidC/SpoIIIJ